MDEKDEREREKRERHARVGDARVRKTRERERREREHARVGDARVRKKRESDESDNAVEGSEEYFDESEHVDGFAAEERSSDGEEVDETQERGTEDARTVAGRAATTGRVDGEIQEELKRPSDCWYVPVCRVWGDSKEDA